ncbi:MAG: hypothetical protein ACOC9Z_08110 [Chloroflexota bacterium]
MNFANAANMAHEVAMTGSKRGMGLFGETESLAPGDRVGRAAVARQLEPLSHISLVLP